MKSVLKLVCLLGIVFGLSAFACASDDQKVAGRTLQGWVKDLDSRNEIVRLRAVKSLGPFGKAAIPALAKSLVDASDGVKYWAADHLGSIGPDVLNADKADQIVGQLEALTKQSEKAISLAAGYALFQIKRKDEHLQILINKLGHGVRGTACSAAEFLGKIGPPAKAALPALEKHFKEHKDYHVRGACQNAIRKVKNEPLE